MKRLVAAALAALLALVLVGCATPRPPAGTPIDIAIGVGFTAGGRAPSLTDEMRALFEEAVWSNGYYELYSGDGEPRLVDHNILGSESAIETVVVDEQKKMLEAIDDLLLAAVPRVEQAAPLSVISSAVRGFRHDDRERRILMIGSGISTEPRFDMSIDRNLYRDPAEFAASIKETSGLPDLTGITIYWSGLGDTTHPQVMTDKGREQLIELWTELVRLMNGELVVLKQELPRRNPADHVDPLPHVNAVYVEPDITASGPVRLGEEAITFRPDSAAYVEPQAAREVLGALARQLIAKNLEITVTGTTARQRTEAEQLATGLRRAERVRETLIELGVPAHLISVDSVGSFWACWKDEHPGGVFSPETAQLNRSIVITLPGQRIEDVCA